MIKPSSKETTGNEPHYSSPNSIQVIQGTFIRFNSSTFYPNTPTEIVPASTVSLRSPRQLLINTETDETIGQIIDDKNCTTLKTIDTNEVIGTIEEDEKTGEKIIVSNGSTLFDPKQHPHVSIDIISGAELHNTKKKSKRYHVLKSTCITFDSSIHNLNDSEQISYKQFYRRLNNHKKIKRNTTTTLNVTITPSSPSQELFSNKSDLSRQNIKEPTTRFDEMDHIQHDLKECNDNETGEEFFLNGLSDILSSPPTISPEGENNLLLHNSLLFSPDSPSFFTLNQNKCLPSDEMHNEDVDWNVYLNLPPSL